MASEPQVSEYSNLTFDEFVDVHFGPPVGKPLYADFEWEGWAPEPRSGIAYLTRLFENGAEVLRYFHDDQIAQGLTSLANCMAIGGQPWMGDPVTPAAERAAVWPAIATFFEDVLAPKCAPMLGHLAKAGDHPPMINTVTYMWWDSFPGFARQGDPDCELVFQAELDCMEQILSLDSIACQEAALHGLGHWSGHEERRVAIIDDYLRAGTAPVPELISYAKVARSGCIL